jgi:predicted DNA-binding transcriptional regulator AlpA
MDEQLDLVSELRARRFERAAEGEREELLVAADVAALLRMTTAWVYAETRANRIPHLRLGRYVRYRPSAIAVWMAEQEATIARERRG